MTLELDLKSMNLDDLIALKLDLEKSIKSSKKERTQKLVHKFTKDMIAIGYSLEEISELKLTDFISSKPKQPAKYVNPNNSNQTWSGFGREPFWFRDYQGDKNDLFVK